MSPRNASPADKPLPLYIYLQHRSIWWTHSYAIWESLIVRSQGKSMPRRVLQKPWGCENWLSWYASGLETTGRRGHQSLFFYHCSYHQWITTCFSTNSRSSPPVYSEQHPPSPQNHYLRWTLHPWGIWHLPWRQLDLQAIKGLIFFF